MVSPKSHLRDTITQTWNYHVCVILCNPVGIQSITFPWLYHLSVIVSRRRDTLYISMLKKYHKDVIVSRLCDSITQTWFGPNWSQDLFVSGCDDPDTWPSSAPACPLTQPAACMVMIWWVCLTPTLHSRHEHSLDIIPIHSAVYSIQYPPIINNFGKLYLLFGQYLVGS